MFLFLLKQNNPRASEASRQVQKSLMLIVLKTDTNSFLIVIEIVLLIFCLFSTFFFQLNKK